MIELKNRKFEIKKIQEHKPKMQEPQTSNDSGSVMTRPDVVDAKVYKLKSAFVKIRV